MMVRDTNIILLERSKTHGDYAAQASLTQTFKWAMHGSKNWQALDSSERESLEMIALKIGRILEGNSGHQDHWDDIAGYAKLISNQIASADVSSSKVRD